MGKRNSFRTILIIGLLISVIILEASSSFFILGIDSIVHGDMYNYGLTFSSDWARQYWDAFGVFRAFMAVSTVLAVISFVSFLNWRKNQRIIYWKMCFLTIAFGVFSSVFGIYYLAKVDYIVWYELPSYLLQFNEAWATPYRTIIQSVFTLIGISIGGYIISGFAIAFHKQKLKITPTKLSYSSMILIGSLMLILSIFYTSQTMALVGLGMLFWGIILVYIRTDDYVKKSLVDVVVSSHAELMDQVITGLNYKGNATYLSPDYFQNPETQRVFMSKKNVTELPTQAYIQAHEDNIFVSQPEGLLLIPSGARLSKLFEKTLNRNFTSMDIHYFQKNLSALLIEALELAEGCEMQIGGTNVRIEIRGCKYAISNYPTDQSSTLTSDTFTVDSILASSIACALAKTTGTPILVKKQLATRKGKNLIMDFVMVDRKPEELT